MSLPSKWFAENEAVVAGEALAPGPAWARHPGKPRSILAPIATGATAAIVGFGGLVAFAALAPVASAVVAHGTVALESDRKKLQHMEGGIVKEIHVQEGQFVKEGAVLFRMEPLQAEVGAGILDHQILGAMALEARLLAERDGAAHLQLEATLEAGLAESRERADQERQLRERRASIEGQIGILETRIRQSEDQIAGYQREREATEQQIGLIAAELVDARRLYEQRLIVRPRLLALEREHSRLVGSAGQTDASIARTRNVAEESRREIAQVRQSFTEKIGEDLRSVRDRLGELRQKLRAARDILARLDVKAPRSGVVQGLKVSTVGEVIQPGAMLLEIAPDDEAFIIAARVRPQDIDGISSGMPASLRFSAFPTSTTPVAKGILISVSRDRLIDPGTNDPYFLARARMARDALDPHLLARLTAGMPADLIVPTQERTLISYLVRPLADALSRGFRER